MRVHTHVKQYATASHPQKPHFIVYLTSQPHARLPGTMKSIYIRTRTHACTRARVHTDTFYNPRKHYHPAFNVLEGAGVQWRSVHACVVTRVSRVIPKGHSTNYCNISREVQWVWPLDDDRQSPFADWCGPRVSVCASAVRPCVSVCAVKHPLTGFHASEYSDEPSYRYSLCVWVDGNQSDSTVLMDMSHLSLSLADGTVLSAERKQHCVDCNRRCDDMLLNVVYQIHAVRSVSFHECPTVCVLMCVYLVCVNIYCMHVHVIFFLFDLHLLPIIWLT